MTTPETEWENEFDMKFTNCLQGATITKILGTAEYQVWVGEEIKTFITTLLSSRDTYWKEREKEVLKSIIRVAKDPDAVDRIASLRLRELLDLDKGV